MNEDTNLPTTAKLIIGGILLFVAIIIILLINPIVVIGAGQRGVVFNNGSGVENRILGEGIHTRVPFVESVHTMPVRVQKSDFKEDTASKDLQRISMNITVNYQLVPNKVNRIYQNVGDMDTIVATVLTPRIQQAVKAQTSRYTAEEVQINRQKLSDQIQTDLAGALKAYDIIVTNVAITNLDYTAEFNQAIENKQLAQQDAEKAKYLKLKAENEASAKIAEANGNASATKINADAEAYKQDKLQQTLSPELLQKMLIERWNGAYPQYMLGGGSVPLLQLPAR